MLNIADNNRHWCTLVSPAVVTIAEISIPSHLIQNGRSTRIIIIKMKATILFIVAFACSPAFAAPPTVKADHPGCMIWWFLPDCPLGKMFGADPLGIYPWEKFCKRYTAFDNTKFCTKETTMKKEESDGEVMAPKEDHVEVHVAEDDIGTKEQVKVKVSSVDRRPRVSARRHSTETNMAQLYEMCANDEDFAKKHHGLCASIEKQ